MNPLKVESPPAKPIDTAYRQAYESHVAQWMEKLMLLKKTTADDFAQQIREYF